MTGPPLLVVAGMPRTATTSLFHMLGQHPQVFLPFRKELGYFLFNHHRGPAWHRGIYAGLEPGQVGLEATPEYFFSPEALARLAAFDPAPRVVLGVRDPYQCAWSLHGEYAKRRFGMPSFDEFLKRFRYRRGGAWVEIELASGQITRMLETYRRTLGPRLLLYDFRVLQRAPGVVLAAIEGFLGLSPHFRRGLLQRVHLNASARRNSRLLSFVASREGLIHAASRLLPGRLLRGPARWLYARPPGIPASAPPDPVPESFAREGEAVRALFAEGGVVLGDGSVVADRREVLAEA